MSKTITTKSVDSLETDRMKKIVADSVFNFEKVASAIMEKGFTEIKSVGDLEKVMLHYIK